jgi:hypothetical protein
MAQAGYVLEEFEHRRSFIRNIRPGEETARLSGFYEWLMSQESTRVIVEELTSTANAQTLLDEAERDSPPQASTAEEIAGVGILFMSLVSTGLNDLSTLAEHYGIAPYGRYRGEQAVINEVMSRYIDPALDYVYRKLSMLASETNPQVDLAEKLHPRVQYPLEITESLQVFLRDHPDTRRNAFVMMRFGKTKAHTSIIKAIRGTLSKYGITGLRADDKQYHDDLFPNVLTYIHGCDLGIAVFERLEDEYFNPNVSLEVGYFRALRKPVCLLKDNTLKTLNTDLVGKLYKSFDPQDPKDTIPSELERWLRDKDIITT